MRVAIGIGLSQDDWGEATTYVVEAERLGADAVWSAEAWGHDAVTPLAYLAGKTERIGLGTGIIQAGTRTPALVAMTAMSMQAITGGRFLLGLGTSGPQVIEGWHGIPFKRPVQRMRETVEIVRRAAAGERLAYQGTVYTLPLPGGEGKALRSAARPRQVPIYLATLSPKSLEMTGELADGWLGTSFMPEHADVFTRHLAAGAARAGRTLADLDLQAGGVVAFGDDLERLIAPRKPGIAFTLGAMGSREHNFYNMAYQRAGYADVAREAQRLWLDGNREAAAALVPDELVLQTNLLGTEAMVAERIRAYRRAGITTLRVQPEGATLGDRLATLGRAVALVRAVSAEPEPQPAAAG
jgi:F420-dependent oxidoreductase-like protein